MAKGSCFLERLRQLQRKHPEIGDVDGLGLAMRMEMCEKDGITPSRALADRMFQLGLEGDLEADGQTMGLVLDIGGYYKNVITLAPSLEIQEKEIDRAAHLLDQLITRAKTK
jgi:4-aminobutyrate aminotransferase-like enzyme